jgi:multidrug efflux pump
MPLAVSTGAGAASRHSIGTGVIGGMIGATALAIIFVPLFFRLVTRGEHAKAKGGARPGDDAREAARIAAE